MIWWYGYRASLSYNRLKMSNFTQFMAIQPKPKENLWITTEPLTYHVWDENSNEIIIVPAWYIFDWASVPMLFWMFIQRVEPRTVNAACIHDYLYLNKIYKRHKCDNIFYEALMVWWTNRVKATAMRLWVRLLWWIYRNNLFMIWW